jgi:aminopeptidase N
LKFHSSKKKILVASIFLATLLLNACVTTKNDENADGDSNKIVSQTATFTPRAENQYLSQEQAFKRSARVSNVSYQLNYKLTGDEHFSASSTINFTLSDNALPLTVDINKAQITSVVINGFSMPVEQLEKNYNQWFITLPLAQLLKGNNTVTVDFTRKHNTNGEGLHRFKDPVDDKVYLYSHFEPAAAQQMFALFDQPDLKATFEMTVSAPK